jgi:hypothetical protein
MEQTLKRTGWEIKKGQSRDTDSTGHQYTGCRQKTQQKIDEQHGPHLKSGMNPSAREG